MVVRKTKDAPGNFSIMLFDGVCNFCSGSVLFSLKRLDNPGVRFCPMQSPAGQAMLKKLGFSLTDYETFIFIEEGKVYTKSEAVIRLGKNLKRPWPVMAGLVELFPKNLLDWFYIRVARHRYKIMGRKKECLVPDPEIMKFFILK